MNSSPADRAWYEMLDARLIRELKGAPLACFILIAQAGQPVSNKWLCGFSGYSDKTVASALDLLSNTEYQLIGRARGGWVLSKESPAPKSRRNSVPTTTILINPNNNKDTVVVSRKNSDFEAAYQACKQAGIHDPSASEIANLEYVTPEFIAAHVNALSPGQTRGLAIVRIKNNEPIPYENKSIVDGNIYSEGSFSEYLGN